MIVNGSVQLGYKNSAWFTANAAIVLLAGQIVYLDDQSGTYKLGDGVTALSALSFLGGGGGGSQSLQDVTDIGNTTTNDITANSFNTPLAFVGITDNGITVIDSGGTNPLFEVENATNTVKYSSVEVLTLAGGSLTGALNEAKSTDIAGGTTIDLATSNGNTVFITGSGWACTSLGTLQAGTKRELIFNGTGTITYNATSLKLPNAMNISVAAGDVAIFVSEGSGNWKLLTYQSYDDSYISYIPTYTGVSVAPSTGAQKYYLDGKTCHLIIATLSNGTSNATTFTLTLPFNAKNIQTIPIQFCVDNGSTIQGGFGLTSVGSNVLSLTRGGGGSWNSSGAKKVVLTGNYEIQ